MKMNRKLNDSQIIILIKSNIEKKKNKDFSRARASNSGYDIMLPELASPYPDS